MDQSHDTVNVQLEDPVNLLWLLAEIQMKTLL